MKIIPPFWEFTVALLLVILLLPVLMSMDGCNRATSQQLEQARCFVAATLAAQQSSPTPLPKATSIPSPPEKAEVTPKKALPKKVLPKKDPLPKKAPATKAPSVPAKIQWLQTAPAQPTKPILYHYTTSHSICAACRRMDDETLSNPKVIAYINKTFHPVRVEWDGISSFPVRSVPADIVENGPRRAAHFNFVLPDEYLWWLQTQGEKQ